MYDICDEINAVLISVLIYVYVISYYSLGRVTYRYESIILRFTHGVDDTWNEVS